jgi:hypothetical protein
MLKCPRQSKLNGNGNENQSNLSKSLNNIEIGKDINRLPLINDIFGKKEYVLKIYCPGNVIRRIKVKISKYNDLINKIYEITKKSNFELFYQDEDEDMCKISNDLEYQSFTDYLNTDFCGKNGMLSLILSYEKFEIKENNNSCDPLLEKYVEIKDFNKIKLELYECRLQLINLINIINNNSIQNNIGKYISFRSTLLDDLDKFLENLELAKNLDNETIFRLETENEEIETHSDSKLNSLISALQLNNENNIKKKIDDEFVNEIIDKNEEIVDDVINDTSIKKYDEEYKMVPKKYLDEFIRIKEMGFNNDNRIIECLQICFGDLKKTINMLT